MLIGGLSERPGFFAAKEVLERRSHDIAVGIIMGFVVTAGKDFAGGSDHYPAPDAKTGFAEWTAVIAAVGALDIPAVPQIGRHERMAVLVII